MQKWVIACTLALTAASLPAAVRVSRIASPVAAGKMLPVLTGGRAERYGADGTSLIRQWPGSYFETRFRGASAMFRLGSGDVILHVLVDGETVATLTKPAPGLYRVEGLTPGRHSLRLEVASESQAGPTVFGGFFAGPDAHRAPLHPHRRQIEFIGDSHTVGYANTSTKQACTEDEIWRTTDTSRAFGPLLAKRYDAQYQINAISGRGVVRNYNGFTADPLPVAYSKTLFSKVRLNHEPGWKPRVIVIALGTNDFTTPLHDAEKWKTRQELHADFEATYVRFVRSLRAQNPHAFFVLWATDKADGEIEAEVSKVADTLKTRGETRLTYVPINGLAFSACNSHPSLADERTIADALGTAIAADTRW